MMSLHSLLNQLQHTIKSIKHRTFRFHLWTMDDLGLAYVSTPKVASNSIRALIRKRQARILFNHDDEVRYNKDFKAKLDKKLKQSLKPSQVERLKGDLYLFSFVRNPLSRLYSCYRDKVVNAEKRRRHCTLSPYGINFGMSFDEFVFRIAEIPDDKANDHFRSLHTFLTYKGRSFVDYVGKVENFNEEWRPLEEKFGLKCPQTDRADRRVSGPAVAFKALPYSMESAEVAIKRYARDIELYDYGNEIDILLETIIASKSLTGQH